MEINELFKEKTVFSLEVFPPAKTSSINSIVSTLEGLKDLKPDFISVTLGAGGLKGNDKTIAVAYIIQNHLNIPAIAHVPGLYKSRNEVDSIIQNLDKINVKSILALRGDRIDSLEPKGDFSHANELIRYVHKRYPDFDISSACYPECHQESTGFVEDINNLKLKINAGSNHLISQLFFNNQHFYDFQEKLKFSGINVPVEAGIMPCVSKKQIDKIAEVSGVPVPEKFQNMLKKYENNKEALKEAGIAYAVDQIIDLLAHGVDGIHLYTMNQPDVARRIWDATKHAFAATQTQKIN